MAPKKKTPDASARPKAAAKRPRAEKAPDSAVERLESDAAPANAPSKRKRSRTDTQALNKVLDDNFAGFSDEELFLNKIQGHTLPERIQLDKASLAADGKPPMGKLYYANLRDLYRSPNSAMSRLNVKDDTVPVDDGLVDALIARNQAKRSTEELLVWCESVATINQMNLVALLKQLLRMPPSKSMENAVFTISVMKMIMRLKLASQFPEEIEIMQPQFDSACCKSLQAYKGQQRSGASWWSTNSSWAQLVLPVEALNTAFAEAADLSKVSDEINEVVESSEVGRRLLARAQRQVQLDKVGEKITAAVQKLGGEDLTPTSMENAKTNFITSLQNAGYDPMARFAPKEVNIAYRGEELTILVSSPIDQFNVAVETFVRGLAVDAGILVPLWSEADLIGPRPEPEHKVDAACVKEASITRRTLQDQLDDDDATSENIKRVMQQKKAFLSTTDRFWRIEQAFWTSLMGASAEAKVHEKILACLPTLEDNIPLQVADNMFEKVESSKLVAFCGPSLRSVVTTVRGYVTTMIGGKSPNLDKLVGNSSFTKGMQLRLAMFCREQVAAGSGQANSTWTGAEAAQHRWASLKKRKSEGDALTYGDLVPMLIFAWLLSDTEQKALTKMKSEIVAKSGVAKGGNATADKKAGPKKSQVDTRDLVRALFKK